jgi:pyruvate kinase
MNIIATIGPSSMDKRVLQELIKNGVDGIRLNFSHFNEDDFKNVINNIKALKSNIYIFGDLCGKKIRIYDKVKNTYKIFSGETIYFCGHDIYDTLVDKGSVVKKIIPLTINSKTIKNNNIKEISMKDGSMLFEILDSDKGFLKAKVIKDGIVRSGKGCNIPNLNRENIELSDRDKGNIRWAIENNIDIISQSYVEDINEIKEIKDFIVDLGYSIESMRFFAKIETEKGVANIVNIIKEVDGIIIGRGDLVPECGIINAVKNEYFAIDKLIKNGINKEIIIATHIFDSMKGGNRPNLPEVESVYNFVHSGVTGFLLAGETSVSKNAINIVSFLNELIKEYKKKYS